MSCAVLANPALSEDPAAGKKPSVLLLENNRVVTGHITSQGETYAVDQSGGILIIAKKQVLFTGPDMQSIYVHLQDSLPKPPRADDHVELARWCLGYRMVSEARFELQAALEIDPGRDDIRRNLNQLDSVLKRPVTVESKSVKPETPAHRMARMAGVLTGDVETLGGLSREAGQEFTRKIQPILMHNCTNAACHGPKSEQSFKLSLVIQGSPSLRATSEKNLLALLKYIDQDEPKSSPLWKLLKSNHGAKGSSIFLGTRGKDQLTTFQNWLLSLDADAEVAEPKIAKIPDPFAGVEKKGQTSQSKSGYRKGEHIRQVDSKSDEEPGPPPEEPVTKPKAETATKPRTVRKSVVIPSGPPDTDPIVSKEPPKLPDDVVQDPFDPNEFNRQQRIKQGYGAP